MEYCGTVEMILTTPNSAMLITGKVISLFAVGLVQIAVFLAPVGLGYQFFRESLAMAEMDLTSLLPPWSLTRVSFAAYPLARQRMPSQTSVRMTTSRAGPAMTPANAEQPAAPNRRACTAGW